MPTSPAATLLDECAAAMDLLAVLRREQATLRQQTVDAYAPLLPEKAQHIARLSTLAAQRHRVLATCGFAASESGMRDWLEQSPGSETDWQQLLATVRDAHEVNRVNGVLLTQLMARHQARAQALGLVAPEQTLYGPNGQAAAAAMRPARALG
jgi:flagella synthesis protein FlgN